MEKKMVARKNQKLNSNSFYPSCDGDTSSDRPSPLFVIPIIKPIFSRPVDFFKNCYLTLRDDKYLQWNYFGGVVVGLIVMMVECGLL